MYIRPVPRSGWTIIGAAVINKIESKIYEIFYNLSKIYEFNIIKLDNNTNIKNIINSKISLNKIPIFIFTKVYYVNYTFYTHF